MGLFLRALNRAFLSLCCVSVAVVKRLFICTQRRRVWFVVDDTLSGMKCASAGYVVGCQS